MYLYRSFICDLQHQLQQYQSNEILKVYRGQIISKDELENLKQSLDQFISINCFFSTTSNYSRAMSFFRRSKSTENTEKIFFEVDANPNVGKTKPFANISQLSRYPREEEVLFMIGSIFRLKNISFDLDKQIWIIQMILSSDDDNDLKEVLAYLKKQTAQRHTNLRHLAKILLEIGKLDLAEKYLERMLKRLSLDDDLHIDLYQDLAKTTYQMYNYHKSKEWFQKLNRFLEQNPSASLMKSIVNLDNLIQIKFNDIQLYEEIGSGAFGRVHRAKWLTNDMFVAVKLLHSVYLTKDSQKTFLNELSLLNRVRHPNIISFYGACLGKEQYALVMECMSLGSLYQLLHQNNTKLSWLDQLSIASQATKGINYLHQFQPPILHRDIKSLNLLLENHHSGYLVKICDFGMAETRNQTTCQTKETTSQTFTLPWAAPEILNFDSYTNKSDIYSLGIVFWELTTHRIPYDRCHNDIIIQSMIAGRRLKIPDDTRSDFRIVIEKCWAQKPDDRPTSVDLLKMLSECSQKQDIYQKTSALTTENKTIAEHPSMSTNHMMINKADDNLTAKAKITNTIVNTKTSVLRSFIHKMFDKANEKDRQTALLESLKPNFKWNQNAKTIAAGNERGDKLNQLFSPEGIHVDDQQQSIYIADWGNHRIVKWKLGENNGQIIAGGNGWGNRIDHLNHPTDVIVDQKNKSLIICDEGNNRVVRWSLENQQDKQIIIEDIHCYGLMMNENGDLFVSDWEKHEVKRWRKGEKEGTIVAGGNGEGKKLNQLNYPTFIFIDRQETVYVSDSWNHRVMKWIKGVKEGIVVAGGQGEGHSLEQLSYPQGLIVNEVGDVYIADSDNHRIMCWSSGSKQGRVVVGGNGYGQGSNQFNFLRGLSFDVENNLYVVDCNNNRTQRFDVDKNEFEKNVVICNVNKINFVELK